MRSIEFLYKLLVEIQRKPEQRDAQFFAYLFTNMLIVSGLFPIFIVSAELLDKWPLAKYQSLLDWNGMPSALVVALATSMFLTWLLLERRADEIDQKFVTPVWVSRRNIGFAFEMLIMALSLLLVFLGPRFPVVAILLFSSMLVILNAYARQAAKPGQ